MQTSVEQQRVTGNMKNIPSIYYTVLNLLAENERCRNEDQYLVCKVWLQLHPSRFQTMDMNGRTGTVVVDLHSIANDFESFESIRRTRQKLQNDLGLYPPTSWNVARGRRIKEEVWRENCRNNFTKDQSKAIMEIYLRAKGATKKNLVEIKKQVIEKYLVKINK